MIVGFFVSATVITLLQFLRLRDRRFLPLLLMFVSLAWAHGYESWQDEFERFHLLAGVAGVVLLFMLSPHQHPQPPPRP